MIYIIRFSVKAAKTSLSFNFLSQRKLTEIYRQTTNLQWVIKHNVVVGYVKNFVQEPYCSREKTDGLTEFVSTFTNVASVSGSVRRKKTQEVVWPQAKSGIRCVFASSLCEVHTWRVGVIHAYKNDLKHEIYGQIGPKYLGFEVYVAKNAIDKKSVSTEKLKCNSTASLFLPGQISENLEPYLQIQRSSAVRLSGKMAEIGWFWISLS